MDHDILIIGGGPSGLSTALHLARDFPHLTSRILVLEKATYPRSKLCAGGLIVDAEILLQHLGLDVSEIPHVDAEKLHFDFEAKGLNIRVPFRHALRVIRRDEFDHWLAQKAKSRGIQIQEGITVKKITPFSDRVTVRTDQGDLQAQVVVGADGSNGVTRRCIFSELTVHTARVLEVITPTSSPSAGGQRRQSQAFFDFFPVSRNIAGYVWDFPTQVSGKSMRCWGIYDTNLLANEKRPPPKEPLAKAMSQSGFDLENYDIKGYPIRWFSPQNEMSVPRILLVGDAAGADSFLGEGISIALGYGLLAAREIGEAFRRDDFSFHGFRPRVLKSSLGQILIARWIVAQIMYSLKWKWFQILVWRILKPFVILLAWIFILNWGKRMPSTP